MPREIRKGNKTVPVGFRADAVMLQMIEDLGHEWGPVIPLTQSDVIRLCVEHVYKAKFKKSLKRA